MLNFNIFYKKLNTKPDVQVHKILKFIDIGNYDKGNHSCNN